MAEKLGFFTRFDRHHALPPLMDLQHVFFCLGLVKAQDLLKNKDHITHQIHRIVPNQNPPTLGKGLGKIGLLFRQNMGEMNGSAAHEHILVCPSPFSIRFAFAIGKFQASTKP